MGQAESFQEDLETLLELASADNFHLQRSQVEEIFANYGLSDDQMKMIYQYFDRNNIIVDEKPLSGKNKAGENDSGRPKSASGEETSPGKGRTDEDESVYYRMYMDDLKGLPPFSKRKEQELLKRLSEGDESVSRELIEGRLRFAAKTAALYKDQGVLLMDLIQEANMALIAAVGKYSGGSFEELILTEIQEAIDALLIAEGNAADVGSRLASQINTLMIVTARLAEELGREATLTELSEKMHMPEDNVKQLVKMAMDAMTVQEDEPISPELS